MTSKPSLAPEVAAKTAGEIEDAAIAASTGYNVDIPIVPVNTDKTSPSSITSKDNKSTEDVFAHLPLDEAAILRRQLDIPEVKVSYFTLFRYATRFDLLIISVCVFLAIVAGALLPLMTVVFGALAGTFQDFTLGSLDSSAFASQLSSFTLYYLYLMIGMLFVSFTSTAGFMFTGERIASRTRQAFLTAILRQNIAFFDKLGAGEITTRITSEMAQMQDGISEKVPLTVQAVSSFFSAFIIAFVRYWKLALILCSTIVAITLMMGFVGSFLTKWTKQSIEQYGKGGSLAEEVFSSIRSATAFNAQEKLSKQYNIYLRSAERSGIKQKASLGVLIGVLYFCIMCNYGLAFWVGSQFIVRGEMNISQLLTIAMVIIMGAISLGTVAPSLQALFTATAAASKIFSTIDRVSPLDPQSETGIKLDRVMGEIELKNIRHIYPSRPEVVVMEDVSLHIPAGRTTALVGASGSGKSTIVGLVERFYDPVKGQVTLDGHDISKLNLGWLRQQISLVSQEPVLFAATIAENIAHGLIGTSHESASAEKIRDMVREAAEMANAHDFISRLPQGYDTPVGERGFLLSGGQKQRVAIARAVISDPKILLLDEATSALDTKSEGVVQAALDKASEGRTTIVIAHRLSTIKNAFNIVVMSNGRIVEQGSHQELIARKSAYHDLVEAQRIISAVKAKHEMAQEEADDVSLVRMETSGADSLKRTKTGTSLSSTALKKRDLDPTERKYSLFHLLKVVGSFNRKEWHIMLTGLFFCIICGGSEPVSAIFFAKCITAISLPPSEYDEMRREVNFWALMFLVVAIVILFAYAIEGIALGYCSEKLIRRARNTSFRYMLRQDMAFFDQDKNSSGALASFLSTDTTHLAGVSGATLGTILISITLLISSAVIGLAIGWKLALVCIAVVPVLLSCGWLRVLVMAKFARRSKEGYENSAAYACEAASAVRTVASLNREADVVTHYTTMVESSRKGGIRGIVQSSILYSMAQSFVFGCSGLGFWYGGTLIGSGEYQLFQFFVVFTVIIFSAQSAGTIFAFAGDMGKSKNAAARMKNLFDREPEIDSWSPNGKPVTDVQGKIEFHGVHFRYPTRPDTAVLRGLDLTVRPGEYIALVGPSGCGKSTTISLLERFYDPLAGTILLDGQDISTLNLTDFRRGVALVSQEPTLYQGTIRENILLGAPDDTLVTDAQIDRACRAANIHDFIASLPSGLATVVGSKGTLLSGGQKQRVAIARALLNDPKVLLLDEATSALDSESERVVQDALDKAAKGRTTIAVAHRLSTIQKADRIFVIAEGRVREEGTHADLMRRGGMYAELVGLQNLG